MPYSEPQMEISDFQTAEWAPLQRLWQQRWPQFPLSIELFTQQTQGDPWHFRPDLCRLVWQGGELLGALLIKTPPRSPAWKGQNPQLGWIQVLLVKPGLENTVGQHLLTLALEQLVSQGITQVRYGGSPAHFFPGVPLDDPALAQLLVLNGFQAGQIDHDYRRSLAGWQPPSNSLDPLKQPGLSVAGCTPQEVSGLLSFLDRCFPGRWAFETRTRLGGELDPGEIMVLRDRAQIVGFAHTYTSHSRQIGPSIYWSSSLGSQAGGLGPIGIDPAYRGRGLGLALLVAAVDTLFRKGVDPMVIDWTTLGDFYGKLGFAPWHGYQDFRRGL
jgi:GNAT superfamily N-acetyltransferase